MRLGHIFHAIFLAIFHVVDFSSGLAHQFDGLHAGVAIFCPTEAKGESADELAAFAQGASFFVSLFKEINRRAAHALHRAGLEEARIGATDPDDTAFRGEIALDADDFNGEGFDFCPMKDSQAVAFHAYLDLIDRHDGRELAHCLSSGRRSVLSRVSGWQPNRIGKEQKKKSEKKGVFS